MNEDIKKQLEAAFNEQVQKLSGDKIAQIAKSEAQRQTKEVVKQAALAFFQKPETRASVDELVTKAFAIVLENRREKILQKVVDGLTEALSRDNYGDGY